MHHSDAKRIQELRNGELVAHNEHEFDTPIAQINHLIGAMGHLTQEIQKLVLDRNSMAQEVNLEVPITYACRDMNRSGAKVKVDKHQLLSTYNARIELLISELELGYNALSNGFNIIPLNEIAMNIQNELTNV